MADYGLLRSIRNRVGTAIAAVVAILLASCFAALPQSNLAQQLSNASPSARPNAHVIMISIDGMVPDYYTQPAVLGLKVPTLVSMKLNGAYAEGVEGVYPTVTYPAHTTLITGVRPSIHGIVQNVIFEAPTDPQTKAWYWESRLLQSETLWSLARKAGLSTAAVGWPVTVGADIDYNVPEIWDPLETPITGKRSIENSTPGLIEKAFPGGVNARGDEFRTRASEYIIGAYKPGVMLIHLAELDSTQHLVGPRTPPALAMEEKQDAYIKRIVDATRSAGIFEQTTFFVVSDHGFAAINKQFEPNVALVRANLIALDGQGKPVSWKAAAWPAGGSCAIVLHDPADKETARQVIALFSKISKEGKGPLSNVVKRDELDKLGAIPRAVVMLDGASGFTFGGAFTGPEVHDTPATYRGTHGYLPGKSEMHASLIIYGEGARSGSHIALARMIDIGPTAAGVLGMAIPHAEGSPISELIKPGLAPLRDSKDKPAKPKKGQSRGAPGTN